MAHVKDLYTGAFIVLMSIVIFIFIYHYNKEESAIVDENQDGKISPNELAAHIKKELERKAKQPTQFSGLLKSSMSGMLRGFLMGMLLSGPEGALVTAVVLGMINPIMTSIEHMY